ncbi:hypothetical protein GGS23DRAFT_604608 [Durotheca rogersii]|uniref:uncharacterized protein n=1 Tax=Durotheca rogersii TaxID=419775 RepID=UPI002221282E|nr:uncharacterized protein GGS23DRAFT_604608 [Durotheca rogersii]KAI5864404.1 hypothetical protein GGS23DRAFT_604608 [Durotheca rogersii]
MDHQEEKPDAKKSVSVDTVEKEKTAPEAADEKQPTVVEPKASEEDDTANDADLSTPPDSSSVSSVNPDMLGDEIIVSARANGDKSPARRVAALEREDVDMADADGVKTVVPHYPKRKRPSLYNDLNENRLDNVLAKDGEDTDTTSVKGKQRPKPDDTKHVILGRWRDSPVPQEEGKHIVVGFIDIRDRLRTRLQSTNINGESINTRLFPLPPGPGGSWVTFDRIVFLDHLVGLDHNEIKEYVKVRGETIRQRTQDADLAAIREAKHRLEMNPPPENPQSPVVAWGREIPKNALAGRPEPKRRRYGSGVGTIAERVEHEHGDRVEQDEHALRIGTLHHPMDVPHAPRKPTRILVGCWSKSSPEEDKDKHAVYGILGANDMFRVKLVRETMDGRYIDGNFPSGAGALWISYDEVTFLPHLANLTRPEIKEYIRVRQVQIDAGETPAERVANETKAVYEAQTRAASISAGNANKAAKEANAVLLPPPAQDREEIREGRELRQHRREVISHGEPRVEPVHPSRHSLSEVELRQSSRHTSSDPLERVQGYANREVARIEAIQMRTTHNQASRNAAMANPVNAINVQDGRRDFQENMHRMQQVWLAQENMRRGAGNDDVMTHMGIKYERKQNGPFKDRLVSQGTIINIDGEDYVEYRVLTKPSFF